MPISAELSKLHLKVSLQKFDLNSFCRPNEWTSPTKNPQNAVITITVWFANPIRGVCTRRKFSSYIILIISGAAAAATEQLEQLEQLHTV